MANQESERNAPKVSRLPLPISDSPLVIDLPDGQKIVVGKMTQGSVIEVATWRGVGRPDSRTSRLMLGMGSGNVNEDSPEQSPSGQGNSNSTTKPVKQKGIAGTIASIEHFIRNFSRINWSATFKALIGSLTSKGSKKAKQGKQATSDVNPAASNPASTYLSEDSIAPAITVAPVSEDAEIEAWLNSITDKASRTSAKASKSTVKKAPTKTAPAKKTAVTKKAAPKTTNKRK